MRAAGGLVTGIVLSLACGSPERPPATEPAITPTPELSSDTEVSIPEPTSIAAGTTDEMVERLSRFLAAHGYRALGAPVSERLEPGTTREHVLAVRRRSCVVPAAVGGFPTEVTLELLVDGHVVAQGEGPHPVLWYCAGDSDREATVRIRALAPSEYAHVVFGSDDSTPPGDLRTFAGGECDAFPGAGPYFPWDGAGSWTFVGSDEGVPVSAWLPIAGPDLFAASVSGAGTTSLRHEGALVWIDLRDSSTWALLEEVAAPISVVVDAATLADASTSRASGRTILEDLVTLTSCQSVSMTVVVGDDGEVPSVSALRRLRGLHFVHLGEVETIHVESDAFARLTDLEGLERLSFEHIDTEVTDWVAAMPFLGTFAQVGCAGCRASAEELAAIARAPRLARVLVRAEGLTTASIAPFVVLRSQDELAAASLGTSTRELFRFGSPSDVFGARAALDPTSAGPLLRALIEDRVGDDYFVLTGAVSDPGEPDYVRHVTRLCGEAARTAVHALGDEWTCGGRSCGPVDGCPGNACALVSFERGAVLAHWSGVSDDDSPPAADTLTPAQAGALRTQIACGESTRLEASFFTRRTP